MPADRGSGSVFRDESLLQFRGREPCEFGSLLTQCQKKTRNVLCVAGRALIGAVVQPERDDTPFAKVAVELVFPEIQLAQTFEEFGFLLRRHKLRSIFESFRKQGQRLEKTELTTTHASLDIGGCRLCERMSDIARQELADAIVRDAMQRYIESRRGRIEAFVDRHFTLAASIALHRRALGWDLLRAAANLFLAGPALAVKLIAWAARRGGMERVAAWLAGRRLLVQTEVAREIEWLVATELLEIPCRRRDRVSYRDAIAETILADQRAAALLVAPAGADPDFRRRLAAAVETYPGSRTATAEIATGFVAAGLGALVVKQATPGLVTLSSALAGMIAQQTAIAAFPLGASLGGVWYSLFPAAAGPGLLAATTAAVFLGGAMLAAFSGVVTDPLQRRLGLHRARLERLLQVLEANLCGEPGGNRLMRDHYVARLVDIFDLAALAMRVSHA
jgi:hypothetical protein